MWSHLSQNYRFVHTRDTSIQVCPYTWMNFHTTVVSEFLLYTFGSKWTFTRKEAFMVLQNTLICEYGNLLHTSQEYACSPVHIHSAVFRWHENNKRFLKYFTVIWPFSIMKLLFLHSKQFITYITCTWVFFRNGSCASSDDHFKGMNDYIHNCYIDVLQYLCSDVTLEYP
jgi:hypothetical protein